MDYKVAFDIDGTILEALPLFVQAIESRGYTLDPVVKYHFRVKPLVPRLDLAEVVREALKISYIPIIPGMSRVLRFFRDRGYKTLTFLSARDNGLHDYTASQLKYALSQAGIDGEFELGVENKAARMAELGMIPGVLFEDRRKTCQETVDAGMRAMMRKTTYNYPLDFGYTAICPSEYACMEDLLRATNAREKVIWMYESPLEIPDWLLNRFIAS